jgi:hypothetical protein
MTADCHLVKKEKKKGTQKTLTSALALHHWFFSCISKNKELFCTTVQRFDLFGRAIFDVEFWLKKLTKIQ